MTKREAKAEGREAGYAAGLYCEVGPEDVRDAGCEHAPDAECKACLTAAAFASEENARQFSPFEFLAHDMNEDEGRSDGLWEAYHDGVAVGIRAGIRARGGK